MDSNYRFNVNDLDEYEIDEQIAIEVFNFGKEKLLDENWIKSYPYSTSMEYAWKVINHLTDSTCEFQINIGDDGVRVQINELVHDDCDIKSYIADESTFPLAVCKAALKYKQIIW